MGGGVGSTPSTHTTALQNRVRTFFMTTSPIYFGYFLPGSYMYLEWLTVFAKLNGNHFPASLSVDTYISLTTFIQNKTFLADFWRLQRPSLPAESASKFYCETAKLSKIIVASANHSTLYWCNRVLILFSCIVQYTVQLFNDKYLAKEVLQS